MIGLAGYPLAPVTALGADTYESLRELGIYCTTHPGVIDRIENGSSLPYFYFDSGEATGETRRCFRDSYTYPPAGSGTVFPIINIPEYDFTIFFAGRSLEKTSFWRLRDPDGAVPTPRRIRRTAP